VRLGWKRRFWSFNVPMSVVALIILFLGAAFVGGLMREQVVERRYLSDGPPRQFYTAIRRAFADLQLAGELKTRQGRYEAMDKVLRQYLPLGMAVTDAEKLLNEAGFQTFSSCDMAGAAKDCEPHSMARQDLSASGFCTKTLYVDVWPERGIFEPLVTKIGSSILISCL
jgi:hypothetical protein